MNDIFIILTAVLVAINCALLGTFLLLRKMAMLGDAVSHAVLPGIVVAYFFAGDKGSVFILAGATVAGLAATFLIDFFSRRIRIQNDAAIGITYTLLFAVGMILIAVLMQGNADIDQECVLYGDIALINFDKILIDDNLYIGPRAMYVELVAGIIVVSSLVIGFKGFKLISFNEDFAKSVGIKTSRWHYFLMALVTLTTVVSFEVVGAILVVGFLVIPPASAFLITRKLIPMLVISALTGIVSVVSGYFLALWLDVSITGMMVVMAGILFAFCFIISQLRSHKTLAGTGFEQKTQEI
ncbi:MAG: metal ABC transporter permease [Crocinitomicaceae bacterium]|nr:metal ABC transporter permease [Crocinitomicaceae bacterium]